MVYAPGLLPLAATPCSSKAESFREAPGLSRWSPDMRTECRRGFGLLAQDSVLAALKGLSSAGGAVYLNEVRVGLRVQFCECG